MTTETPIYLHNLNEHPRRQWGLHEGFVIASKYGGFTWMKHDKKMLVAKPINQRDTVGPTKPPIDLHPSRRLIVSYGYDKTGHPLNLAYNEATHKLLAGIPRPYDDDAILQEAIGGWLNGRGEYVEEPSIVLSGIYGSSALFGAIIRTTLSVFNQESLLSVAPNGEAHIMGGGN